MSVVVITGAAKGIGKAIAERLITDHYKTILVDVDENSGTSLAKKLGDNAHCVKCDISNEHEVEQLFKKIIKDHESVDVLVNNAGIIKDSVIWKMETDDFDNVISINLKGTWLMCKQAAIIMKQQQSGRIINISSRAWLGNPGQTNYSASKAGVIGLTRSLALELAKYGILVNAVAPGLIDTPLTQNLTDDVKEKLIRAQPTKSMGAPADVANTVSFLSNEQTRFITGQVIYVDGGKSIGAGL